MKFTNILSELILEGPISNDTLDFLFNKWKTEKNDLTPDHIRLIWKEFDQKKNGGGFSVDTPSPIVKSFLRRFDKDKQLFPNTESLKNIKSYSYKQVISLLTDYPNSVLVADEEEKITTVLDNIDKKPSPEKIEASKGLWSDPSTAYINEGSLRVYRITGQKHAEDMSYYLEFIHSKYPKNKSAFWCVTARGGNSGRSSAWTAYRTNNTFYFVIDDKRLKDDFSDNYYLGALMYNTNGSGKNNYVLEPLTNNDSYPKSWEEIVNIYPELENHKSKIVPIPFNREAETSIDTPYVSKMSEQPGPFEFASSERKYKLQYINTPALSLQKVISWEHMDEELKRVYINKITRDNYESMLSSNELVKHIEKNDKTSFKKLKSRLDFVLGGNGWGQFFEKKINAGYKLYRVSKDNKDIVIIKDKNQPGYLGIYDKSKKNWVELNGVIYDDHFIEDKINGHIGDAYSDEELTNHFVEKFKNVNSNTIFYVVYESDEHYGDGHFISEKKFDEIKLYDSDLMSGRKVQPDNDVDIKEYDY